MNINLRVYVMTVCVLTTLLSQAEYKILCLKGKDAMSGQDQNLKKFCHTSYHTGDDYQCYIKFNPRDVKLYNPAAARYDTAIKNAPTLPSYDGKLIYFVNNVNTYMPLINILRQTGATLNQIGSAPIKNSWEEIAEEFEKTFQ